jgi:hypothetical protein
VFVDNGKEKKSFLLDDPATCLVLDPPDWHTMKFGRGAILLVLSSEHFDASDYVDEAYQ